MNPPANMTLAESPEWRSGRGSVATGRVGVGKPLTYPP